MASERDGREVLAETEFLFGLRKGDRRYDVVVKILELCKKGLLRVRILSSAVVEVKAILYSHGLKPSDVEEACSLMDIQLVEANIVEYEPLTLADVVLAGRLRSQSPRLTFFDSLHAATAKRLNKALLSNDPIYREVEVKTVGFKELVETTLNS